MNAGASSSPTPAPEADIGDPVAVLTDKGITCKNCTDISVLVSILEEYGNWHRPSKPNNITVAMAAQIYHCHQAALSCH